MNKILFFLLCLVSLSGFAQKKPSDRTIETNPPNNFFLEGQNPNVSNVSDRDRRLRLDTLRNKYLFGSYSGTDTVLVYRVGNNFGYKRLSLIGSGGGGGTTYTAGFGLTLLSNQFKTDTSTIASKAFVNSKLFSLDTTRNYGWLGLHTFYPSFYSKSPSQFLETQGAYNLQVGAENYYSPLASFTQGVNEDGDGFVETNGKQLKWTKNGTVAMLSDLAGSGVSSIFGRSGAVVAADGDYNFSQISGKPNTLNGYGIGDGVDINSAQTILNMKTFQPGIQVGNASSNTSFVSFASNTSDPADGIGTRSRFWIQNDGDFIWKSGQNGFWKHIFRSTLTNNRIWTMPDSSGRVALQSWVLAQGFGGGGGAVSSVFGRTGTVTAQSNDYTFAQIGSKPTTISGYGITDNIANTVFGRTGTVVATSGDYNTSQVTENTNLYYTDARVRAAVLTGLSTSTQTAITSSDGVLVASGKLQGQIDAINTLETQINNQVFVEHFNTLENWDRSTTGTGAATGTKAPTATNSRVMQLETGTTSTGRAFARVQTYFAANHYVLGSKAQTFISRVRLEDLSDGTNRYIARFTPANYDGTPSITRGIGFEYTDNQNSGNWRVFSHAGSLTYANTSVAVAADTDYLLKLVVNAAGTQVLCYIDGTLVSTITTQIPTGTSNGINPSFEIIKTAGTTNRLFYIDEYAEQFTY